MGGGRIAIVGIGLCYPDADTPGQLWENVLAGRRAFRTIPRERLNLDDYWSPDTDAPDRFYSNKAALLRGFEFDREKYRIAGSTFRSTDMTHWLALETAARAFEDAGFPGGDGLPRRTTGVVLGNSLTGEFARANTLRLRWPYVRRTLAAALGERGWAEEETADFLAGLETAYKAPFPEVDEDTLAGGLSNTIAGRLCNHFDLNGGGYTVDGACSSSLLSVTTAARALADGDLDAALAGGVDLSIDPFELVGFARTGALATGEMRVYDRGSNGFWPGEGAGAVLLMREEDAIARGARVYALITGWAVSSDGRGGITRPEEKGHVLALERAYSRAGYGADTVGYFEGHGTGTALGDATEIAALSHARGPSPAAPAALGSIKGNIGHTKAAAGVAGLIKAALAVHHGTIPPGTSHRDPHPLLLGEAPALRVPDRAEPWPREHPVRAGVSAMGFGGVNTHVALEAAEGHASGPDARALGLVAGRQDAELLLLDADTPAGLRRELDRLADLLPRLSFAELTDLAADLALRLAGRPVRCAIVADAPLSAARSVALLAERADAGETEVLSFEHGIFLSERQAPPRITFLFPGQGSGSGASGAVRRRFAAADAVLSSADVPAGADQTATEVAQPRIVAGSLAALAVLDGLGVSAGAAVGHSLGEITALHWAGAMDADQLLSLAAHRGRAMADTGSGDGAMAGLSAPLPRVLRLLEEQGGGPGEEVVVAGHNGPEQTVVSGRSGAVEKLRARAEAEGVTSVGVNVSHAFHSPLVAPSADALERVLAGLDLAPLSGRVVSTVTGTDLEPGARLRDLLRDQVVRPVLFHEAVTRVAPDTDLFIEAGPGRVLSGLAGRIATDTPVLPTDTDSPSLSPLLRAVGAAFALGAPVRTDRLFHGRLVRPLPEDLAFLASPCEAAPDLPQGRGTATAAAPDPAPAAVDGADTLQILRELVAGRVELPVDTITGSTKPLDELHLSSITVGQIVNEATRARGLPPLEATSGYATSSLADLAATIDGLARTAGTGDDGAGEVAGIGPWVRSFRAEHRPLPAPVAPPPASGAGGADWSVYAPCDHSLAKSLEDALAGAGIGDGVLLVPDGEDVGLPLAAAQEAIRRGVRLVLVQDRPLASGLARTLHLEAPEVPVTVVEVPDAAPADSGAAERLVETVVAEAASTTSYAESRHGPDGRRSVPVLTPLVPPADPPPSQEPALGSDDVLLVTGGGKGITAECALALAADHGTRLLLIGRSDPAADPELAANLERVAAAGVRYRYERADVTSPEQVAAAVSRAEADLGAVTAVLHGSGRNEPAPLSALTAEEMRATIAPKVDGLRSVLAAVDPAGLRLLVSFGSIIGRSGLRGEAHYATANDRMSALTAEYGHLHPHTRVLAVEWSVWSGAGMGERMGVVEALTREGITPISVEEGIAALRALLADPRTGPVVVVSGRTGPLPTLPRYPDLPLGRFLDRVLVHYPGVELVTETELAAHTDPYLDDHRLDGDTLLPAVLGMEAMAQVAAALSGHPGVPVLEDMEFLRPITVPGSGATTVRVAALVRDSRTVEAAVRSEETGYATDHFRAVLRWAAETPDGGEPVTGPASVPTVPPVPLDPVTDLYGSLLFQGKLFQRLLAYRKVSARRTVAEVAVRNAAGWFAPYLPQELVLADPGARDTVMHALQAGVPDAVLLPERVDRLRPADPADQETGHLVLYACERAREGDSHVYDVEVRGPSGRVVERWEGLRLRAVRSRGGAGPWAPPLLGPHLERSLESVLDLRIAVALEPGHLVPGEGAEGRRSRTERAVGRLLDRPARVRHRPDGRPEVDGAHVSVSHTAGVTLAVAGEAPLGCDIESCAERPRRVWADLLGPAALSVADLVSEETGEPASVAGTRVWAALECLRKTGTAARALTLERVRPDGWVLLSAGAVRAATWVTTLAGDGGPTVVAVADPSPTPPRRP
ncbi:MULTISPECIES: type I polyketide synthase [unclassified Nocardiopsis]|uniref:type I polyketide synthase n=1 Tax=unclassified Nocardiopsis TaxID=2649073 RepID=UPI001357546F|nr:MULTISPECIES: type I polyketide synthase [unclassified Nocardiopsis]